MTNRLQETIDKAMHAQYGSRAPAAPPAQTVIKGGKKKRNQRSSIFEIELAYLLKRTAGVPPFECNAEIIPGRKFEFDFVWRRQKVALELEGGVWRRGGGAHSHPTNIIRDIEKSNLAALAGFRLLRFTTDDHRHGKIAPFLVHFFR